MNKSFKILLYAAVEPGTIWCQGKPEEYYICNCVPKVDQRWLVTMIRRPKFKFQIQRWAWLKYVQLMIWLKIID